MGEKMRRAFKRLIYGIFIVFVAPLWALYRLHSLLFSPMKAFEGSSQFLSLFPGIFGNYLRWAFYKLTIDHLGEDTCLSFGVTLADPRIRIGRGVYIGAYCNLGLCTIEDDILLGTGVHVMSGFSQHGYSDLSVPIREQEGRLLNVFIGRDSWIGNGAIVGNHVGMKCVIGAAALVTHEIPPYSVAVGNPAKIIRDRRDQLLPK
jgi:virginiamycin A acetyltransferase